MRILLYSYSFAPAIGGVESVGLLLGKGWEAAGHQVTVLTETPASQADETSLGLTVIRRPKRQQTRQLVESHDLIVASAGPVQFAKLAFPCSKPFVLIHHGYQLQCIDGLGWLNEERAPMTPISSFFHHARLRGLTPALSGVAALCFRRMTAHLASANVAVSHHLASRQQLPRQVVIHNACDTRAFVATEEEALASLQNPDCDFAFLGRLVSEKGVNDLLQAFALFLKQEKQHGSRQSRLKIIGDGPQRTHLQELAQQLRISENVIWTGALRGAPLVEAVKRSAVFVVPSRWEEPMPIAVIELLAAGKPLIVSERGGQHEAAGDACLTFQNGNTSQLFGCMKQLASDRTLQTNLAIKALARARSLTPEKQIGAYLSLFQSILEKTSSVSKFNQ